MLFEKLKKIWPAVWRLAITLVFCVGGGKMAVSAYEYNPAIVMKVVAGVGGSVLGAAVGFLLIVFIGKKG